MATRIQATHTRGYIAGYIRVRTKTGQLIDMVPAPAIAMVEGGSADYVALPENIVRETAAMDKPTEKATFSKPIGKGTQRKHEVATATR